MTALPVVDVSGLSADDPTARRVAAAALGRACEDVGFLQVVGHGVPQPAIDGAFAAAHRFFALPIERKAFATLTEGVLNRGYDGVASQQLDPGGTAADLKEVWDVGLDLPWDHPLVVAGTPMHGPNPWPDDLPWFRPPVEAFYDAARALTERLLAGRVVEDLLAPHGVDRGAEPADEPRQHVVAPAGVDARHEQRAAPGGDGLDDRVAHLGKGVALVVEGVERRRHHHGAGADGPDDVGEGVVGSDVARRRVDHRPGGGRQDGGDVVGRGRRRRGRPRRGRPCRDCGR